MTIFTMKKPVLISSFLLLFHLVYAQTTEICLSCEQLKNLQLPDVTVIKAEAHSSDSTLSITVPFCRVLGLISREINFELLLPIHWNGRFLMSGGGGFVGSIQNNLRHYVNQGYATAGTDTGHKGEGTSAEWALNNMERQLNFGRLAIHRTAVVSKSIVTSAYCTAASYSYFLGCSRGGGQAMVEAQYYPEDFDGIVAGAPAFSWPAIGAKFLSACQMLYKDGKPIVTNDHLKLVQEHILKQCDKADGVVDKIINDPRACSIDLSKIPVCPDDQGSANCLTKIQRDFFNSIYHPLNISGNEIYPGFPVGLEAEPGSWDVWITGTNANIRNGVSLHYLFGTNMYKYLVFNDPTWDYKDYDFKTYTDDTMYAASYLDATQTDYDAFKAADKRMIIYHGWNDPALSAYSTIQHYEAAQKKDSNLPSHIRLFLLPGVLHCGGGPGPDRVDWVQQIQLWVEKGIAPEKIVLSKFENGKPLMTRPVYPYPLMTIYTGKGDVNQEQNFKPLKN